MAKTLANYDPLVQIPSGMTPAGADFPIVESHDILVGENDKRLDAKLDDIDSAIGNVGQTPIATQLSSKVNTGDIVTSVAATGSTSNNKIPSETAVRAAIEAKTINVDSTVTQGSTNAVSGGAVHTQLATKQDVLTFDTTPTASSSNPVTSGGVKTALDAKQDALTFDTTPTASSSNPVTSGGVKAALDNKQNTLTYETTPIVGSVNPVTSTGIRNAIDTAAAQNLGAMQAAYDTFSANISAKVSSLSNGMVACSDISAETTVGDTRILLYTGTTNANYTNGHWYYNSAPSNAAPSWTDGGAVGSAPTIDNTLTVEGAAANSKAVGDAIENIVTISNTQPGSNSGNKVWIKETTSEEVQVPTYAEHIAKANKADIATNNESDNGSGTISASKKYAIGDHFYINNTNTSSENFGVSTLYKATAAIASGDAIVVGTNCEASKVADEITSLSNDIGTVKADLDNNVNDLKSQISKIENPKNLLLMSPLTENKYYYGGASASTSYSYFAVAVENGKTYKSTTRFRFISHAGAGISNTDTYTYTATADETIYFTLYNNERSRWALCESTVDIDTVGTYDAPTLNDVTLAQTIGQSKSKVMSQKAVMDAVVDVNTNVNKVSDENGIIETAVVPSPNLYKAILNGYILNYQNGNPSVSASYETSDYIHVKPGDEIHYQFDYAGVRLDSVNYSGYSSIRIVCAYRGDKTYISDSYVTSAASYTVPADAEYIRVSFAISTVFTNRALIKATSTDIVPYFEPNEVAFITPKYLTPKNEYKHFSGEYSDEIKFTGLETSAKAMILNAVIDFDTLPTFALGIKNSKTTLFSVSVDASKLYVYDYVFGGTSSVTTEYTHGLTLGKDLAVSAVFNNKGVKVSVCSGGEKYEMDNFLQITRAGLGYPYLVISSGEADYVSFSASAKDINRHIWIFGDSYLSDSSDRWGYYLNQSGVDTYLIDAYPGENSANSLKSLQNLLKIGHPSYIVWCLGMNDGTDSDAPRPAWKSAFDEVKRLCHIYGIEMIGATIPTVPSINNEYKNAYVKNSGLKYIDFAKAVGASSSGVWYDGMLYKDNVHPTAKGARALYYTAITDFQQLQIKNH